ncbi:MAG: CHAT domain-containing protein [Anaerolineae bacterium]|nr:CHAT domain-containing protein [Anaerolineae bacterium]
MSPFTDLQLRIFAREADTYPVELTVAGGQHSRGALTADVLPWTSGPNPTAEGQRLFVAVFADRALCDTWVAARTAFSQRRVRLWLDAPELHTLPWELLHDGHTFLAAGGATPFSRYVPTDAPWCMVSSQSSRVLLAIADPDDLEDFNLPRLDIAAEQAALPTSDVDMLDPPVTLARIEHALQSKFYRVCHFVGHGAHHRRAGQTLLYLQDDAGYAA